MKKIDVMFELLENHKGLKSDLEKAKNQKFEYLDDNVCSCCSNSYQLNK